MEGEPEGVVTAESPTASDPSQPTPGQAPSAPAQPGLDAPEKQPPFNEHPRWQQLMRERQQERAVMSQMSQKIQQLESLQQRAQQQGGMAPDELRQYQEAYGALEKILSSTPKGQKLLAMLEKADDLMAAPSQVQQQRLLGLRALEQQGLSHISQLADQAKLPADEKYRTALVRLIQAEALEMPNGAERFRSGDLSVLDEAFKAVQESFIAHMQRAGQALAAKQRTSALPPAPRGGAAGPAGLEKFDPNQPNAIGKRFAQFSRKAREILGEGGSAQE